MPFEVYVGTVAAPAGATAPFPPVTMDAAHAAHMIPSTRTIHVSRGQQGLRATLSAHQGSQPVRATRAMAFINELGRHVTVRWVDQRQQQQEGADSPRVQVGTVVVRANRWHVIPADRNFDQSRVIAARRHEIRPTPSGTSCTFRTSMCGKDMYIVVFDRDGRPANAQYCCVTVVKRIRCHYREMPQSSGSATNWTLTNVLRESPLQTVTNHYLTTYGIYLINWNRPEANMTYRAVLQANQPAAQSVAHALIPAAQRNNPPPRDLWIGAVNRIRNGNDEWAGAGGGQLAAVALHESINVTLPALRGWWGVHDRTGQMPPELAQLPANERPFYRQLAQRLCDHPDVIIGQGVTRTLMHEIGHALGLVPSNQRAAGNAQSGWHTQNGHCSTSTCVMDPSGESFNVSALMRRRSSQPFDGHDLTGPPEIRSKCALYLIACDLSDLSSPS